MASLDIILNPYNHLELTISCVKSLYENTKTPFRLTVVDDSQDLTPKYFEGFCKEHPNCQFIHQDEWIDSAAKKQRIGLEHTDGEIIMPVGNSVTFEPDWETSGMELMAKYPEVGIVGLKILNPHGTIWYAGTQFSNGLPSHIGVGEPGHRYTHIKEMKAVTGGLWRRETLRQSIMDDRYIGWVGFDDIDWALTAHKNGWKILYCGLGAIYHIESPTRVKGLKGEKETQFWANYNKNMNHFVEKWKDYLNDKEVR